MVEEILKDFFKLAKSFERLSSWVWDTLCESYTVKSPIGEETFSDLILFELAKENIKVIKTSKFNKTEEGRKGADWEWWIGSESLGYLRHAIQAKKIDFELNYQHLFYKKEDGELQLDILEQYCKKNNAIPLYCFYNYYYYFKVDPYWHCCKEIDYEQFGCTITPSRNVRELYKLKPKNKNFTSVHSFSTTLPIRCLVSCPDFLSPLYGKFFGLQTGKEIFGIEPFVYKKPPSPLISTDLNKLTDDDLSEFYSSENDAIPSGIVLFESSAKHEEPNENNGLMTLALVAKLFEKKRQIFDSIDGTHQRTLQKENSEALLNFSFEIFV